MKTPNLNTIPALILMIVSLVACGPKSKDSKDIAKEENATKFEDSSEKKDAKFATNVADAGMLEVQVGQLAKANGSAPKVKEFGQMLIDDHSKANEELKALADKKDISLPASLSAESQKKYEDLSKKTGADFDKAFCDAMVKGHEHVIDEFRKEADSGNDPDLKTWASDKLPTLEHHLDMARQAKEKLN